MIRFDPKHWALILGGSSGFGLATAKKLARHGMSVCVVHRDRKGVMDRIEKEFDEIRATKTGFLALNLDGLSPEGRKQALDSLTEQMGKSGRVRLLLHSIAFGNLKPIAPVQRDTGVDHALERLAQSLGVRSEQLRTSVEALFHEGLAHLYPLITPDFGEALIDDEDMARTVYSMGTSLLTWVRDLFTRKLFAEDARVLGLTSEGNEVAWRGYAAVSVAKVALESVSRAIATEFAPHGIRSNVIQPGTTNTPALRLIPGAATMKAGSILRNPFKRLTTPEDVANFICLMCTDEAAWVNGAILRVDGGERISSK